MSSNALRIATRASNLALWQANHVAALLRSAEPELEIEFVHVSTTGDRVGGTPLSRFGGFGVFTREIQQALLEKRADVAVHSLKDLPTEPVDGVALAAVPERDSPFDALVLPSGAPRAFTLGDISTGARVGTGSQRRRAQILHVRPDLALLDVRGNVDTRIRKLDAGDFDALILAEAGLDRLGFSARISRRLAPPEFFPAVGQGALGIECRTDDAITRPIVARLIHPPTFAAVTAERQILARLRAGCHAPVGVSTQIDGDRLKVAAVVLSRDGTQRLFSRAEGSIDDAEIGMRVADELLEHGARRLIDDAQAAE